MKQFYRPSNFDKISYKEAALPVLKVEISGFQNFFFLSLIRRKSYMQYFD
jgi:hypothetical protein